MISYKMTLDQYIDNIDKRYRLGNATEHTFRGDLQQLLESLVPTIRATNEPKRQSCGAPDYILTKKDIPVGYIEAKDIGDKDLDGVKKTGNKEQFDRYKASLNNLIFTDYLNFHLYHDGELITKISIAEITEKGIKPLNDNFAAFENLITDFCSHIGQTIKSSKKLAEMMAGKARLLSDIICKALTSDEEKHEDSTLKDQMLAFKEILIHDITPQGFADVYAQTIAYGMFAARLHDPTLPTFSRQEAAELIPKSNPFLRKLFGYIAGPDIDDRIKWVVDGLVEIFLACNVEEILKNYGKSTKMEDPIIHFYETFLSEYDPKLRKSRGVWYTPQPVVNFIVRAVDDILKTEFDLPQGLADTSKTKIKVDLQGKKVEQEVHKVQILDPATGTGTFLAEVVKHIHKKFAGQQGIWSNYVETHLLPRLNGFELLMASYAMAHLKLDLLLTETGYKPTTNQRFRVYLTNSLEESHPDTGTLFANWLSSEANEANKIKRDSPVMCVIGNPPYSGESANKGEWIMKLMEDYKKEPGGKEKLKERNPKWINDDYVKFLRYGQHFIEKNGSGVLAFINPHGFLDNPTFRGMRWHLLKTYDKIYTIDLHGNAKKKETAPDGSTDTNVFDIEQGVSINFFIKTGKKKPNELGKVFHFDLYGKRDFKYDFLNKNSVVTVDYKELPNVSPNYFFVNKDFDEQNNFDKGFSVSELLPLNNVGIATAKDAILINFSKDDLVKNVENFYSIESNSSLVYKASYRLFDDRFIYYDTKIVERAREKVMFHFLHSKNIGLTLCKQFKTGDNYLHAFITNKIIESSYVSNRTSEITSVFPLYIYPDLKGQQIIGQPTERTPNLNPEILKQITEKLGLIFTNEKETTENTFAPIDILDYIYAVLHSPTYREKYKEFLKIDFPRVPYPKDKNIFWQLVKLGGEIRQIHLLESSVVENYITQYPEDGDNVVAKPTYKDGKVFINENQYFDNVPQVAWEFYIGGYQPAQKWLKDRKDRKLEFDDILHYQKIIVALSETDRLMKEIDKIEILQ
nr:type ISP restriction/modification enzyme [Pedobacter glucosidilyticus]